MKEEFINRTFIQTKEFSREWDSLGFNDEDLRHLELMLLQDPKLAPVMQGTGGLRKMRFAFEHRGKSGSTRICYVDFVFAETIYLITCYPKDKKDNLTKAERNAIKKIIQMLEKELKGDSSNE